MDRRKALRNAGLIAGGGIMVPSFLSLLQSCEAETRLDWQPEFLSTDEAQFIATLVDRILPTTDTPGALDVKVDMFIDKVFSRTYTPEGQQYIKTEIAKFNKDCKEKYGKVFAKLSEEDQTSVLREAESSSGKFNGSVWGTAVGKQEPIGFYRSMKSMALWAYTSSEKIGKEVLSYDPIPTKYEGCIPLASVGNSWSL